MSDIKEIKNHLIELRKCVLKIIVSISIIGIFVLTFHINIIQYDKIFFLYPTLDPFNNITIQIIESLKEKLVPYDVQLIQTAPGQVFFAQIYVSVLISTIMSMPIIIKEIIVFLKPALTENEINIGRSVAIPSIMLFVLGCFFAYFFAIPYLLEFLYKYGESAGIITFLNVIDFVTFVLQFLLAFGISFQIPIIMYTLSKAEIINKNFWKSNMRYAIIVITIFGAIITPDGSGITMWFIAGPMILLYLIGLKISK